MCVFREGVEEPLEVLVEQRVAVELAPVAIELSCVRQLTAQQEVADLEEAATLSEILDGVAAVPKNPVRAVRNVTADWVDAVCLKATSRLTMPVLSLSFAAPKSSPISPSVPMTTGMSTEWSLYVSFACSLMTLQIHLNAV